VTDECIVRQEIISNSHQIEDKPRIMQSVWCLR